MTRRRRRTQRRTRAGFTLMEILIAMALAAIVSTSVLAIVRTQLIAFELNDQVVKTQQNARSAMDFLETVTRRACGGISGGRVGVSVAGITQQVVPCLRFYDAGSGYTPAPLPSSDAIEVVYASGTMTAIPAQLLTLVGVSSITVRDATGFSAGDYVLVGDFAVANLYKVQSAAGTTITFDAPATASGNVVSGALLPGSPVLKATSYSMYVSQDGIYSGMLMVDPDGVASANHKDYTKVQPAVEGVVDFQVAVGIDDNFDGTITESTSSAGADEWRGNSTSDSAVPTPTAAALWNPASTTTAPQLRQVRLSLILQTANGYPGTPPTPPTFEDHPAFAAPAAPAPRYRSARITVAPRAWNLSE
jgi:prepilin-type N-terminal cleavage/methylation domain-containing protein